MEWELGGKRYKKAGLFIMISCPPYSCPILPLALDCILNSWTSPHLVNTKFLSFQLPIEMHASLLSASRDVVTLYPVQRGDLIHSLAFVQMHVVTAVTAVTLKPSVA